jgi:hypothetical protein
LNPFVETGVLSSKRLDLLQSSARIRSLDRSAAAFTLRERFLNRESVYHPQIWAITSGEILHAYAETKYQKIDPDSAIAYTFLTDQRHAGALRCDFSA